MVKNHTTFLGHLNRLHVQGTSQGNRATLVEETFKVETFKVETFKVETFKVETYKVETQSAFEDTIAN